MHRYDGAPRLSRHFESSVPGLYVAGVAAAASFGPLARFIAGAPFVVPRIAAHLAATRPHRRATLSDADVALSAAGPAGLSR